MNAGYLNNFVHSDVTSKWSVPIRSVRPMRLRTNSCVLYNERYKRLLRYIWHKYLLLETTDQVLIRLQCTKTVCAFNILV